VTTPLFDFRKVALSNAARNRLGAIAESQVQHPHRGIKLLNIILKNAYDPARGLYMPLSDRPNLNRYVTENIENLPAAISAIAGWPMILFTNALMTPVAYIRSLPLDGDAHSAQVEIELETQLLALQRQDHSLGVAHLEGAHACADRHTCAERRIDAFDVRGLMHISRRADQIGRGAAKRQARAHAADAKRIDLTAKT
jgi:hypothetical protein